jgi:prophage regulatory protein
MSNQSLFLRLKHILGDRKSNPPIPPLVPLSRSTLWAKVKEGSFPKPVRLGPRTTAWRAADVLAWAADPENFKASSPNHSPKNKRT